MAQEETSALSSENQQERDFQFLLCERCRGDVQSPKLLPCLHNLCSQCLVENKPIGVCAICGAPYPQNEENHQLPDNLLFATLQAKLRIYQKIHSNNNLICPCKNEAVAWCSDCEDFFCSSCFEFHQRYLKRESHEAKSLKDLQEESSTEFLAGIRKQTAMFCSNIDHKNETLRIYCKECKKSMCCVCALLDNKHNPSHHCGIRDEIRCRQNELQSMGMELKEKKNNYNDTYNKLHELMDNMEKERNKMKELIQQKIGEMVKVLQEKEELFLKEVEDQHKQRVQNVKEKLKGIEGVVKRMASSEQLVEKINLFASDQELLDMHPYIKESLQELKGKQPPVIEFQIQAGNFAKIETQLQSLFERVTKVKEVDPAGQETAPSQSPAKRKHVQEERAIQSPRKVIKTEPDDTEWMKSSRPTSSSLLAQPGTSSQFIEDNQTTGSGDNPEEGIDDWFPVSFSEYSESDKDTTSEDEITDDDSVASSLLQNISNRFHNSQEGHTGQELDSRQGTMVFFDLKLLPGGILHLAAIAEETNCFSIMIQPLVFSPMGAMRNNLGEIGLEKFLHYLHFLRKPILVGYKIWSLDLFPVLVNSLQNINREEIFQSSIYGLIEALPLIKEKNLNITSYTLRNLASIYLWTELNDSRAVDCAKALKDLCTVLEVNPMIERKPVIAYSNLQCYTSLQPLLKRKLLSNSSAQTLALRNICLSTLQSVYQLNPEKGLQILGRYLNSRQRDTEKKIRKLNKIGSYFQGLLSVAWGRLPAATS